MLWSVCSRRSTMSHVPIHPRSRAASAESRYRPMFVDDVRCAMTGAGSSWKLSGGRPLSSGPMTASKKRQAAPRGRPKGAPIGGGQRRERGRRERLAHPSRDGGRQHPEDDERRGDDRVGGRADRDQETRRDGERDRAAHAAIHAREPLVESRLGVGAGHPLEHLPPADREAVQRAHDHVGHEPRLMSEEHHVERALREPADDSVADSAEVRALADAGRRRPRFCDRGDEHGQHHRDQHELRPERR